jgi:serine/threonine-protein kinase
METSPLTGLAPTKYRFLGKLGEGGMAEVFLGVTDQAPGFRKLLVLKLLRMSLAEEPGGLTMFLDEARLAARLNHRNVVQTYEVGQVEGRHAIVMEFLEGATLSNLHRAAKSSLEQRTLPLAECLHILCEALGGLHYAHELKDFDGCSLHLVHRDFTPANLMVTLDGQVKVLDFGVAKTRKNLAHTSAGMLKGTARYMAREAVLGHVVDRRADVYMAGAVLWHMVTGTRPWDDKEEIAVLAAILQQRLPPVRELNPALSPELEAIILRATSPEPSTRYQTAQELREALLGFAREHALATDPDKLAALVRELAGESCEALRRRIDEQLAEAHPVTDIMLATTVAAPSHPGVEATRSRIRVTGVNERTLRIPHRFRWLLAAALTLPVAVGAALFLRNDGPHATPTDIHLTLELPDAPQATVAELAASPPETVTAHELPAHAPQPSERITMHLSAEPAEAQLFLDGVRLAGNPHELTVKRDDAVHELRAEAPGYSPKVMVTRLANGSDLTLKLAPERAAKRHGHRNRSHGKAASTFAARSVPETMAPNTPQQNVAPKNAKPSSPPGARRIDTESPWQH